MAKNQYFAHNTPDGKNVTDQFEDMHGTNHPYTFIGENIYHLNNAQTSEEEFKQQAFTAWYNSPGHRENMEAYEYDDFGYGYYHDDLTGTSYGVQLFGATDNNNYNIALNGDSNPTADGDYDKPYNASEVTLDNSNGEQPVDDQPTEEQPVDDQPTEEQPVDDQPTEEQPVDDQPTEEQPADDQPTEEQPADEQPVEEQPVDDQPTEEQPVDDQPTEEQPADEQPVDEQPVEEQPVDEIPENFDGDKSDLNTFAEFKYEVDNGENSNSNTVEPTENQTQEFATPSEHDVKPDNKVEAENITTNSLYASESYNTTQNKEQVDELPDTGIADDSKTLMILSSILGMVGLSFLLRRKQQNNN